MRKLITIIAITIATTMNAQFGPVGQNSADYDFHENGWTIATSKPGFSRYEKTTQTVIKGALVERDLMLYVKNGVITDLITFRDNSTHQNYLGLVDFFTRSWGEGLPINELGQKVFYAKGNKGIIVVMKISRESGTLVSFCSVVK